MAGVRGPQAGSGSAAPRLPRRRARSFGLEFCIPEIPRNYLDKTDAIKAPKYRQNGRLLVLDPKEKVMIEPSETMSKYDVSGCTADLSHGF
nr:glutamate-rich protein 2-like [Equus caballus]